MIISWKRLIMKHINTCKLYSKDINQAINKLNIGIGFDLVHSQHLKNINNAYKEFIVRLFSAFISHNYLPEKMLYGEIIPLIKNKLNNKCESNNFRSVMVSSNMFKMFEYCLLQLYNYIMYIQIIEMKINSSCYLTDYLQNIFSRLILFVDTICKCISISCYHQSAGVNF